MLVQDWYIIHKKTGLYPGASGYTRDVKEALFHTCTRRPYTKAAVIKEAIFEKARLKGYYNPAYFKVEGGRNEREVFFTDYPVVLAGDPPGQCSKIRPVRLISYDQDKYIKIMVLNSDFSDLMEMIIETGYLYDTPKYNCNYRKVLKAIKALPKTVY